MSSLRGRFSRRTDDELQLFSSSLEDDMRFWREDIDGSLAHATLIARPGLRDAGELAHLRRGRHTIAQGA